MILNGAVTVPDPKGNVRTLLNRMELRLGLLPQGALMKLSPGATEPVRVAAGKDFRVPLTLVRTADFRETARVELVLDESQQGQFLAESMELAADAATVNLVVRATPQAPGFATLKFRATAMQQGKWKVMSETTVEVQVTP